jgi:ribonuclease HI
MGILLLTLMGE